MAIRTVLPRIKFRNGGHLRSRITPHAILPGVACKADSIQGQRAEMTKLQK